MTRIDKPWGYEEILENNGKYVIKLLHVQPGQQLSTQYHRVKQESMYCLQGTGTIQLGALDDSLLLTPQRLEKGSFHMIPPGLVHRLSCDGDSVEDLVLLECSTPELDDIVRLEDVYGRV